MKYLLFILFPLTSLAQPNKGLIYSLKHSLPVSDTAVLWQPEELVKGRFYRADEMMTIDNVKYAIDSVHSAATAEGSFYIYYLSQKKRKFRCYLYPLEKEKEWGLLLDKHAKLTMYKFRE